MKILFLSIALFAASGATAQMVESPPSPTPTTEPTIDLAKFDDVQMDKWAHMCDPKTIAPPGIRINRLPQNSLLCRQVKARIGEHPLRLPAARQAPARPPSSVPSSAPIEVRSAVPTPTAASTPTPTRTPTPTPTPTVIPTPADTHAAPAPKLSRTPPPVRPQPQPEPMMTPGSFH
jgi:hypothetical protein